MKKIVTVLSSVDSETLAIMAHRTLREITETHQDHYVAHNFQEGTFYLKRVQIREQKCICLYAAGHFIGVNFNLWKTTPLGQKISEYLDDPKFDNYMKSIFFDTLIQPRNPTNELYILRIMKEILKCTYRANDRENVLVYANCTLCEQYCTVNFVNRWNSRLVTNWLLCPSCYKFMLG